jgi:hypothetical protein
MTTFLEAATSYGIPLTREADSVVAKIEGGKIKHRLLGDVASFSIDDQLDVYVASGGFSPGSVTASQGRTKTNLRRIWALPFDCDLADFLDLPKETVYAMPQAEIEEYLPRMVEAISEALQTQGLPVTFVGYTGHGVLAWVKLASVQNDETAAIDQALKTVVKRINQRAGFRLVDPQGTDAGTRICRIVGSLNGKSVPYGLPPRQTRELVRTNQYITAANLVALVQEAKPAPVARVLAESGSRLSDADARALVESIAPHWQLGQKHALSLALGGMLAKAGVPEIQALAIVEALSASDNKPWDRAKSVASSYARARAGGEVRGYFALRDYLPIEIADFIDGVLDQFRESQKPRIVMKHGTGEKYQNPDEFVASMTIAPVPAICFDWPWVREYMDLMRPTSEAPDQFHLAVGLSIVGATLGRAVSTRYVSKSVYANLYHMLVGSAGTSRKDTAIRLGVDLPLCRSKSNLMHTAAYNGMHDVGSAQGLIKELSDSANTLLYITEYQRLSQQAHRQSTGTIFPTITAAWDTPIELQNKTTSTHMRARMPYLSILAAVQPGILAEEMTQGDIQSGYATRWLYVPGLGKAEGKANPPEIDDPSGYQLYANLLEITKSYSQNGGETRLYLDASAEPLWDDWYQKDRKRNLRSEDEASMSSRLAVHIRKVALIYAALDLAGSIEEKHLNPAIAYVEWCWNHTRELMKTWGVGIFNQIEARIEQVLEQRGPVTRRQLYQQCRNRRWSTKEFAQVFEAMIKTGMVVSDPSGLVGIPGDV